MQPCRTPRPQTLGHALACGQYIKACSRFGRYHNTRHSGNMHDLLKGGGGGGSLPHTLWSQLRPQSVSGQWSKRAQKYRESLWHGKSGRGYAEVKGQRPNISTVNNQTTYLKKEKGATHRLYSDYVLTIQGLYYSIAVAKSHCPYYTMSLL